MTAATGPTTPAPLLDPTGDAERWRRLRRMRWVATGLLAVAAIVFVLTRNGTGFWGFVNAGAEASMVGAIADWFAVTALFRHPLGLPVPHTALVPNRKDDFAVSLEEFFSENFLAEEVVRERIAQVDIVRRVAQWAADEAHAQRLSAEIATVGRTVLARIDDDEIDNLVRQVLVPQLIAEPISPLAGSLLGEVVQDQAHHQLVDLLVAEARRWLLDNEAVFTELAEERAPWWSPAALNDHVIRRAYLGSLKWLEDIAEDPYHQARFALDDALTRLAEDLQNDPETQERAERLKARILEHPQLATTALALWGTFKRTLHDALGDEDGPLRVRIAEEIHGFADRVLTDDELRERMDRWVSDSVVFAIERYGDELTAVITHTINRWDGKEAAERIELHVGPDLQFIRINGTIVGGLVGVLIHTVAVLFW